MATTPGIELKREMGVGDGQFMDRCVLTDRILHLSSWAMVLGTVRLICTFADFTNAFLESTRGDRFSLSMLGRFFQENPPALLIGMAWPLVLALLLRKSGWPELLRAMSITFFILSVAGFITLFSGITLPLEPRVVLGSFSIARWQLFRLQPSAVLLALLGFAQLLCELWTAVTTLLLWQQRRAVGDSGTSPSPKAAPRRSLMGRLALYISLAFLVLNIRMPVWSAYLEILNRSNLVREFILKNDTKRHYASTGGNLISTASPRARELREILDSAIASGQVSAAKQGYLRLIRQADAWDPASRSDIEGKRTFLSTALNNLAWMLTTSADQGSWDPQQAVALARRAVELAPEQGTYWNTLGVAHFRRQDMDEARSAFQRSMELRNDGDSFDWFFLAMMDARSSRKDRAQAWYDKAVAWFHQTMPADEELYRFQVEAAQALGLDKPSPPHPLASPGGSMGPPSYEDMERRLLRPRGGRRTASPRFVPGPTTGSRTIP